MTKRLIFCWMGLALLLSFSHSQEALAKQIYKVKRGDTLVRIADQLDVSVEDLKEANGLKSTSLKLNQALSIPKHYTTRVKKDHTKVALKAVNTSKLKPAHYTVKKGDTLLSISRKTGLTPHELKALNGVQARNLHPGHKLLLASKERKESKRIEASTVTAMPDDDEFLLDEGTGEDGPVQEDWDAVERDKKATAELLGKWNSPDERRIFVRVAKGFLGTPYRFGGSTVRGIDCSAFVAKIYQFFDVQLPRTAREQSRMGVRVVRGELEEGDLVFFNTWRAFGHVGIYIGNNEFIHASSGRNSGKNVRINNLDEPYYNNHFIKAVRLKGMKQMISSNKPDVS
jgi:peptidoglycan DL-endopeptidase LytE